MPRDPEAWFASTQATIFKPAFDNLDDPWQRMVMKVVGDLFERQLHDRDRVIEVYLRHNEAVPGERLNPSKPRH